MLSDSFAYAKDGLWGNARRWFLLLVSMVIFPFILGYIVRIYRGANPAPELEQWGSLFVSGLKYLVVQFIYALPVILLIIAAFLPVFHSLFAAGMISGDAATMTDEQVEELFLSDPDILSSLGVMVLLLFIAIILAVIIGIFSYIGSIRFARTDSIMEAFNFSAILATIRALGWVNYLLALVIVFAVAMVYGFIMNIVMMVPFIGFIIWFFMYPPFLIFMSRYATLVYDAAGQAPVKEPFQV